jgi:L-iditol 2-dehydrogenase
LLETLYSGVTNGTERHALMVDHGYGGGNFPSRHGYQHVCRVAAIGEGVESVAVDDVVFVGMYVGHRGWHVVPAVPTLPLGIRLPDDVDHGACALLGVAGVALRAVRRLRIGSGQNVWSVGVGPIGIFGAQCARACGARVTVTEFVENRLHAARETGAHEAINMADDDAWDRLRAGGPYDAIIECSGHERLFFEIFERGLLAHGGRIGAIAVRGEATFPWSMLHGTEASIEVSCHFSESELAYLLQFLQSGVIEIDPIISHRVPVTEAPAIYATMRDDPRALYGVIFDWQ